MRSLTRICMFVSCLCFAGAAVAQPYFHTTATANGNNILVKIKAVNGPITCGWSDIEFFFRNSTGSTSADGAFSSATITVNTTNFPGVSIPYNGMDLQGSESGYTNYWFGISFTPTTPQTYAQNQEYTICTIALGSAVSNYSLEMCHNEPNFWPHYLTLTDQAGEDRSSPAGIGINKFYGPGAFICQPNNCPPSTPGNHHILPLTGALPVSLLDFQVKKHAARTALLLWETAQELDFFAFEIERSTGSGWEKIGLEKARGAQNAGAAYHFYDRTAPAGTVYYRLKMLDLDGSFEYSPTRKLQFETEAMLAVFPNPADRHLHVQCNPEMPESDLLVELYDGIGRRVFQQQFETAPGAVHTLPLGELHLADGPYFFKATSEAGFSFVKTVLVQNEF